MIFGRATRPYSPQRFLLLAALYLLAAAQSLSAGGRITLNFNTDWRFLRADEPAALQPTFDDSKWALISAPHTFNDVDTFDDWSVANHVGETNQWSGRVWYRKSFVLPEAYKNKRVFLEFEAVRQVAEVYLNGQALGTNQTGFIPFGFELTSSLKFGGATNVLAVMADNRFTLETELAKIAATELPWNSPHWHPAHGGIYRNVYLHVTDPLHITLPLFTNLKTVGPYAYASDISEKAATVHCEIPVQNGNASEEPIIVRADLLDRERKSVAQMESKQNLAAGGLETFKLAAAVTSPQLWEPAYPYLYTIKCTVESHGQVLDTCEVPLGIRFARWDALTGLFLNGYHLKLHGWGQKPTSEWPGLGAAQPDWLQYFTLDLMKQAGGNFVRWGHCAGAPAALASSDQLGLLVEQPGVDGEGDAKDDAWTLRAAAFRDMLVYYRNHPSIVIWEGGNQKVSREHAQELRALLDKYDPQGGRAFAFRRANDVDAEFMDVGIGTEGGREIARLPVIEGEYDREESPRRVWDEFSPPRFGYPEAKNQTYQLTSEQYAVNQVNQYVSKLGAPNHCGGANWIFSDSTSGGRVGCEVARASGEVDGMRLPKEAYYVCQAMFCLEPKVHIIGHWTYAPGVKKNIYVASNCDGVELFLNGKSLGRGKRSDVYLFTFPDVVWEAGELKAVASREGNALASQTRHTVGPAVSLQVTPLLGPKGLLADGSDVALFDVEAVDAKGERCPPVEQRVDFELTGPAVWRGGYNSGKIHSINNSFLDLECGINRVSVRATRTAGTIQLIAKSSGLKSASIQVTSQGVEDANGCSPALPSIPVPPNLKKPILRESQGPIASLVKPAGGRFLKAFSYSGPTMAVAVHEDARDGAKIYTDRDYVFTSLPDALHGCDWVQTANADKLYSAVDLMELAAAVDGVVYIAHDNRLPCPDWLQTQFKQTEYTVNINGQNMKVFEKQVRTGESLTLGANAEARQLKSCNMYVVFVKRV